MPGFLFPQKKIKIKVIEEQDFLTNVTPQSVKLTVNDVALNFIYLPGADLGGGCRGCAPSPPPWDDLRFSYTTGILQKKNYVVYWCFEVEQETSAPPPKKIPGSSPAYQAQHEH